MIFSENFRIYLFDFLVALLIFVALNVVVYFLMKKSYGNVEYANLSNVVKFYLNGSNVTLG